MKAKNGINNEQLKPITIPKNKQVTPNLFRNYLQHRKENENTKIKSIDEK